MVCNLPYRDFQMIELKVISEEKTLKPVSWQDENLCLLIVGKLMLFCLHRAYEGMDSMELKV